MKFDVGDIVRMKKPHPCGNDQWEILRTGIDFKIRCLKCGHLVMLSRVKFEKGFKKMIVKKDPETDTTKRSFLMDEYEY